MHIRKYDLLTSQILTAKFRTFKNNPITYDGMHCLPKKRICDSCHTPGDASGEGVRCLPGTQPAPRLRRGTRAGPGRGVGRGRGDRGSPGSSEELMPALPAGHGGKDGASGTQRDPHGACWSPQEGGRQRLTRGQSLSCWGCVRLGRN